MSVVPSSGDRGRLRGHSSVHPTSRERVASPCFRAPSARYPSGRVGCPPLLPFLLTDPRLSLRLAECSSSLRWVGDHGFPSSWNFPSTLRKDHRGLTLRIGPPCFAPTQSEVHVPLSDRCPRFRAGGSAFAPHTVSSQDMAGGPVQDAVEPCPGDMVLPRCAGDPPWALREGCHFVTTGCAFGEAQLGHLSGGGHEPFEDSVVHRLPRPRLRIARWETDFRRTPKAVDISLRCRELRRTPLARFPRSNLRGPPRLWRSGRMLGESAPIGSLQRGVGPPRSLNPSPRLDRP